MSLHSKMFQNNGEQSDITRKVSYGQKHEQQHQNGASLVDSTIRKRSQHGRSPERIRRISQYSKEIINTGHTHYSNQHEKEDKLRRISQYSKTSDGGDVSERQRKISHHGRDGAHLLKDPTMWAHWRARAGIRREHERYSVVTSGGPEVPISLENTYKLEPDAIFRPVKIKAIINSVLQEYLTDQSYDRNLMASRCLVLSGIIKRFLETGSFQSSLTDEMQMDVIPITAKNTQIKSSISQPLEYCGPLSSARSEKIRHLKLDRFKIVTIVLIGENKSQALLVSSRCLWNPEQDNFASCEFSQGNLCAVGMVFAVYQE